MMRYRNKGGSAGENRSGSNVRNRFGPFFNPFFIAGCIIANESMVLPITSEPLPHRTRPLGMWTHYFPIWGFLELSALQITHLCFVIFWLVCWLGPKLLGRFGNTIGWGAALVAIVASFRAVVIAFDAYQYRPNVTFTDDTDWWKWALVATVAAAIFFVGVCKSNFVLGFAAYAAGAVIQAILIAIFADFGVTNPLSIPVMPVPMLWQLTPLGMQLVIAAVCALGFFACSALWNTLQHRFMCTRLGNRWGRLAFNVAAVLVAVGLFWAMLVLIGHRNELLSAAEVMELAYPVHGAGIAPWWDMLGVLLCASVLATMEFFRTAVSRERRRSTECDCTYCQREA